MTLVRGTMFSIGEFAPAVAPVTEPVASDTRLRAFSMSCLIVSISVSTPTTPPSPLGIVPSARVNKSHEQEDQATERPTEVSGHQSAEVGVQVNKDGGDGVWKWGTRNIYGQSQ